MTARPPVIRFADVTQIFNRKNRTAVTALSGVSFDIARHEFVAVLGPSGCGKSTLLRLLAGLVAPTRGRVEIYDHPVTEPRDDVGIVFQRPVLLPWFDVLGNATFPLRHKYGRVTTEERTRAEHLLSLVGLQDFLHHRIDELSGGMQQRVAIARALLLDPDILLMDEPFSALDALTRDEMSFELLRIWSENPKTVVFITHSIPEAVLLADRIVVMTPRPGAIREILTVPLPRPRSLSSLTDPAFHALAHRIRGRLFTDSPPDARSRALMGARVILRRVGETADNIAPLLACIGLVLAWEIACRAFRIPVFLLPAPSAIVSGALDQSWQVWLTHVWATVRVALLGYAAAIAISIPLAIALASSRLLSRSLYPIIVAIHATPIVAVAPIIVVSLGTSDLPRVTITFLIAFFPIVVSTATGLLAAPPEMIELSRSLRAGRAREMLHIRIPFAVPYIFSALRISITLAFVGAVVAEFVAAEEGLGYFIQFATSFFKISQAFAALVILVATSLLSFQIVTWAQGALAPWSLPKEEG